MSAAIQLDDDTRDDLVARATGIGLESTRRYLEIHDVELEYALLMVGAVDAPEGEPDKCTAGLGFADLGDAFLMLFNHVFDLGRSLGIDVRTRYRD